MAITRSEFDDGKWVKLRTNDTADDKWDGALKKLTCERKVAEVGSNDYDIVSVGVLNSMGDKVWRVDVRAFEKTVTVYDNENRAIREWDMDDGPGRFDEPGRLVVYNGIDGRTNYLSVRPDSFTQPGEIFIMADEDYRHGESVVLAITDQQVSVDAEAP